MQRSVLFFHVTVKYVKNISVPYVLSHAQWMSHFRMKVPAGQSPGSLTVVLPTPWKNSSVRAVIESCSILALLRQNFWARLLQKHRESHGNRDCPRSHRIILSWRRQCGKMDWDCNAVQGNCELNLTNQRVCKTWELWQLWVRLQCKALS